ncbi:MAG: hypothetical protein ACLRMB_03655, partial [Pilosibacter sp.]
SQQHHFHHPTENRTHPFPPSSNLILSFLIEEVLFLCYDRNRKTPMTGMAASLFIARLARST